MDDKPGRLVDDDQVLVLENHGKRDVLSVGLRRDSRRDAEHETFAGFDAVGRHVYRPPAVASGQASADDQALEFGTRAARGQHREHAVDPLARHRLRHGDPDDFLGSGIFNHDWHQTDRRSS